MSPPKPPRRADVIEVLSSVKRAMHTSEVATRLGIEARMAPALSRVLDDLVFDGTVVPQAGQRFRLAARERERSRGEVVEGFLSVNPRGFGFVQREGDADDVFIPAESIGGAMHGDRVRARVVMRSVRGVEGAIEAILDRRSKRLAGTLRRRGRSAWVEPDDTRIRGPVVLAARDTPEGEDGEVVVVDIDRFPESPDENPEGHVVEVLGRAGEPDVEVRKILAVAGVEEGHPSAAEHEASSFGDAIDPRAMEGREDLTGIPLPTIDPKDARDHDDAVWAERKPEGGYRVWIAIADVSHYVAAGTALDAAAKERGCSIYLPDRAIPMLPRALSGNLCSLLPDVLRLCLCVIIDLDAAAEVRDVRIVEGFMKSQAKLTYEGVARALKLTAEPEVQPKAEELRDGLSLLREVSTQLRAKRMRRGALDFDLPETRIVVDQATRQPIDAERRARDPGVAKAYQIVEELMLLANECVARFLVRANVPAIFRVHAPPDPVKIERFAAICEKLGIDLDVEDAQDPKKLSAFVRKTKGHPSRALIDTLLVRSLKQAMYDIANVGHFGLASDAYLHFTSPIRRYPDLSVHRTVRALLRGERVSTNEDAVAQMRAAAQLASERERRAMQVEREVVDLYGALLMRDAIGDMFTGSVSGIVSSGVFVALEEPYVSVLVKSEALGPESYEPDEVGFSVTGTRSGDRITLGDGMMVQIEEVSLERRTVYGRRVSVAAQGASSDDAPKKPRRGKKHEVERPAKRGKKAPSSHPPRSAKAAPKKAKSAKPARKKVSAKGPSSRRR